MPRVVAFLRGVSPQNARMPDLKAAFESAGFTAVRTVLASGNVVFDAESTEARELERRAEVAMSAMLGRAFYTIVRHRDALVRLLADEPYTRHRIPLEAKRVISFLREPAAPRVPLPLAMDHASVFLQDGREIFSAYVPTDKGPVFMKLIEQAFGTEVTTRTWDTVARCAAA